MCVCVCVVRIEIKTTGLLIYFTTVFIKGGRKGENGNKWIKSRRDGQIEGVMVEGVREGV